MSAPAPPFSLLRKLLFGCPSFHALLGGAALPEHRPSVDLMLKWMEALRHTSLWAPSEGAAFGKFTQACLDFSQGRGGDQFLKDSAQDLKNRRNINKVGLLPNPFPLPRDYYIEPTLVPGSVCCSAASQRWAPWSWGKEEEERDFNIWPKSTLLVILQNEAGEYVDMNIPR